MLDCLARVKIFMFQSVLSPHDLDRVSRRRAECLIARGQLKDILVTEKAADLDRETDDLLLRTFPSNGSFNKVDTLRGKALLDRCVRQALEEGRLTVLHEHRLREQYAHLYFNSLSGTDTVDPETFYGASMPILDDLFEHITYPGTAQSIAADKAHIAMVWRAAFVAVEPACRANIRRAIHFGMSRNHTPRSTTYFKGESASQIVTEGQQVIGFDPMFATGGTMLDLTEELLKMGFTQDRIVLSALFAVPEGLVRVLKAYPHLRGITVGRLESGMNDNAYLVDMAVGDYGDRIVKALRPRVTDAQNKRMITGAEAVRLMQRIDTGV